MQCNSVSLNVHTLMMYLHDMQAIIISNWTQLKNIHTTEQGRFSLDKLLHKLLATEVTEPVVDVVLPLIASSSKASSLSSSIYSSTESLLELSIITC